MKTETPKTWEDAVRWLKAQPDQHELVLACFYDDPLCDAVARYHASTEWRAVRDLIPAPPGNALDIGAGRGISSFALARDGWTVTALEPDGSQEIGTGAINTLAKNVGLNINVVEASGEQIPFADGSFDLVHCRQVLHHARDLAQLCREVGRVLRPGGCFIATREHVISRHSDLPAFLKTHPLHGLYGGEYAYLLSDYLAAIRDGGVVPVRIINPNESDVNLFPQTREDLKRRWAKRLLIPFPSVIPDFLLGLAGAVSNAPGRLYSFVCRKPLHA